VYARRHKRRSRSRERPVLSDVQCTTPRKSREHQQDKHSKRRKFEISEVSSILVVKSAKVSTRADENEKPGRAARGESTQISTAEKPIDIVTRLSAGVDEVEEGEI
jgi:hypothetical protein